MSFALLPAAGQSARMGRPKLSLPLGDRSILEQVIRSFRQGGVSEVVVVLGPATADLTALAQHAGAVVLCLPEATAEMRVTVELGLKWLEKEHGPKPDDPWLLCPADHPVLEPSVINHMLEAWKQRGSSQILVPVFNGQRGHPAAIAWSLRSGLQALPAGLGLNVFLRKHSDQAREMPVATDSILFDLDTPEDYVRLLQRWEMQNAGSGD